MLEIKKILTNVKRYTIDYIKKMIDKYKKSFPRRTQVDSIGEIDIRAVATQKVRVGIDLEGGYVGTKVRSEHFIECTNFDKILTIFEGGTFCVNNIPEKQYLHHDDNKIVFVGIADKESVFRIVYRDLKTNFCYVKRFIIKKFILNKTYNYLESDMKLEYITTQPNICVQVKFKPMKRQKISSTTFELDNVIIKRICSKRSTH